MSVASVLLVLAALAILIVSDHVGWWPGARWPRTRGWLSLVAAIVLVSAGLSLVTPSHAGTPGAQHVPRIPPAAQAWRPTLTREARAVWGLDAPVSLFGAQIQQESDWRPHVASAYAAGLAQFTRATARDMARWYPALGPADAYDPHWAIRAMVRYDRRLYAAIADTATDCDRWAMTLSAYNGGPGWLTRDRALCRQARRCDPTRWWNDVAHHTHRADWAKRENRAYPRRILRVLQPVYVTASWPGQAVCP